MMSQINEIVQGEYNHDGPAIVYGDTDSVAADSIIITDNGSVSVETLFVQGDTFWKEADKEYSSNNSIKIAHPSLDNQVTYVNYDYIYRHRVSKGRYKVTTADGNQVIVTEDHSVMVLVDGNLIEKKASDILVGDAVISIM
jgi:intein/homing endonuclease